MFLKIVSYLMLALGAVHVLFTPFTYSRFTLNALWFAGSGLAIVLAGFLNLVFVSNEKSIRLARPLCLITNSSFTLLFALALFLLTEPQVFVGLLLFGFATVATFLLKRDAA